MEDEETLDSYVKKQNPSYQKKGRQNSQYKYNRKEQQYGSYKKNDYYPKQQYNYSQRWERQRQSRSKSRSRSRSNSNPRYKSNFNSNNNRKQQYNQNYKQKFNQEGQRRPRQRSNSQENFNNSGNDEENNHNPKNNRIIPMIDEIKDDQITENKLKELEKQVNILIDLKDDQKFPRLQYYQRKNEEKKDVRHYGQRKLFMSELYFLTQYHELAHTVIYAGAAPGNHIPYLADLFPNHNFILIDPNPFSIQESERIKIINDYYTDEMCENHYQEFKNQDGCLFISDIRTACSDILKGNDHERRIVQDNDLQRNWVKMLRPKKGMIKFRCPYPFFKDKKTATMYDGDVYIQPWAPQSSTETRVITDADQDLIEYDNLIYEEKLFNHNQIVRKEHFDNPIQGDGLWKDYDSSSDVLHIYQYLKKFPFKYEGKNMSLYHQICDFSFKLTQQIGTRKSLGYKNPPKDQRFKFKPKDHADFYEKINIRKDSKNSQDD